MAMLFDPSQWQQADPNQPGVPGIPMMPGAPPEVVDQTGGMQPPMPPQAGSAPGAGMDPTMIMLLQQMMTQSGAVNPRMAQLQAYMQMQRANPGQGPFTNLVNPIVNALMARQAAPAIQQQMQAAQATQRLKVFEALAKMQGAGVRTALDQAKLNDILNPVLTRGELRDVKLAPKVNAETAQARLGETQAQNQAGNTFRLNNQTLRVAEMQQTGEIAKTRHEDALARMEQDLNNQTENRAQRKEIADAVNKLREISVRQGERRTLVAEEGMSQKEAMQPGIEEQRAAMTEHLKGLNKTAQGRADVVELNALLRAGQMMPAGQTRVDFLQKNVKPLYEEKFNQSVDFSQPGVFERIHDFFMGVAPTARTGPPGEPGTTPGIQTPTVPPVTLAPGAKKQPTDFSALDPNNLTGMIPDPNRPGQMLDMSKPLHRAMMQAYLEKMRQEMGQ